MKNNEKKYVEKIINTYGEKEVSKVEKLRKLDNKAKRPATIFAYVFGTISSLILGFGMSVAMGVILKDLFYLGVGVGCIGLALCIVNYFIYKAMLKSSTKKYASEILSLSNEIINE